jgi:hypothetical protein
MTLELVHMSQHIRTLQVSTVNNINVFLPATRLRQHLRWPHWQNGEGGRSIASI